MNLWFEISNLKSKREGMNTRQKARLYHELGKLIGAGMHLDRSTEMLLEQKPAVPARQYLQGLKRGLAEHLTVSQAIEKHNAALVSGIEIKLLEAGERGGRLAEAFMNLARYFELRQRARAKAVSALIYPLILLHLGMIMPDLPALVTGTDTHVVIGRIVVRIFFLWIGIGGIFMAWNKAKNASVKSTSVDRFLNMLPLIGPARRHWALARFCQVFQTGLFAAMNISETLKLAGGATQSAVMNEASKRTALAIESGGRLAASMKITGAFPVTFVNAVQTAEETGTLDVEMGRWSIAESEMAAQAQERAAEWIPRVVYVLVMLYVATRIFGGFQDIYGPESQLGKMLKD